jgi:hypothetical protein
MKFSGVMIGTDDPDALGEFSTKVLGEAGFHDGTWYGWGGAAQPMRGAQQRSWGE